MMKNFFEQNGGSYSMVGDYRLPNLTVPEQPDNHIGIWGRHRLNYLKHHRRILYVNLLTSGGLNTHLHEIDVIAYERWKTIINRMAVAQSVTEKLKAENQMLWVGMMNNIRAIADEIIQNELIYN